MKPFYPMHIIDPNAEYRGVSVTKLMDRAGKESYKAISQKWNLIPLPASPERSRRKKGGVRGGFGKKIQIFCGSGNNGGDGFALAAELIQKKIETEVILAIPKNKIRTAAAKHHFSRVPKENIQTYSKDLKIDGAILVDALLGIGVAGKLKHPFDKIVQRLNRVSLTPQFTGGIVSLDIPTGSLKPDLIIAYHSSKSPLISLFKRGKRSSRKRGEQGDSYPEVVVPIGIPKIAETHFGPGDVRVYFPRRKADSHKGKNGQVVIVGGSKKYLGAPYFAGLGALAGGADLVHLFVPEINFPAIRKSSPNLLVSSFTGDKEKLTPEAVPAILKFAREKKATLVVGCGLGNDPETIAAIQLIIQKTKQPLVLDADAINPPVKGGRPGWPGRGGFGLKSKKVILTPHSGEFRRLTRAAANSKNAKLWAKKLGTTILLKGSTDTIASPDGKTRFNDAGSPILTTGGTGDLLAGLIGSLISREVAAFEACGVAAFLLGYTANELEKKYESVTPQLLSKNIPRIIQSILKSQ